MAARLVDAGWGRELTASLRADPGELRLVSPFIKAAALDRLLSLGPGKVRAITRFNLDDFSVGVSDIEALRMLLDAGARVRGIRGLHAKLYLFGASRAVVTSANLTMSALDGNHEFGLVAEDAATVLACRAYFDDLWRRGETDLAADRLDAWAAAVARHRALGGRSGKRARLGDFGVGADFAPAPLAHAPMAAAGAPQAFVKFVGTREGHKPLSRSTFSEVEESGCHWVVGYPRGKPPSGVREGALVFLARPTSDDDIRVFGRAIAMEH